MENELLLDQNLANDAGTNENSRSFALVVGFIRRFFLLICIITLLGLGVGLWFAVTKDAVTYTQSKSVILLVKINGLTQRNNLTVSKNYLPTVKSILTTPKFIKAANSKSTVGYISAGAVSVEEVSGTILKVSYSDLDKDAAAAKLDVFIDAAQEVIQTGGFNEDEGLLTADEVKFDPIDQVPVTTSSSGFVKYVALGVLGGLVLGIGIAFIIYILDNTVRSKEELERLTGSSVIAYLEDVEKPDKPQKETKHKKSKKK
ncbi:MAG: hypothetical protein J5911_00545 [Clostridia bacterium]|nr:hypothetical protein [Clostridia bacterium]